MLALDYLGNFNLFYNNWDRYWDSDWDGDWNLDWDVYRYIFPRGLFEAISLSFGEHMLLSTLALFSVIYLTSFNINLTSFNKKYINKIKNKAKKILNKAKNS